MNAPRVSKIEEITDIYTHQGDESHHIGSVQHNDPDFEAKIGEYWHEWREAVPEPEADSDFVRWLVLHKGVHHPSIQTSRVYIEV